MKKTLSLLTLLLTICSGVWADPVTIGITTTTSTTSGATGTERSMIAYDNLTVTHQLNSGTSGALSEYTKGDKGMYYGSSSAIYSQGAYKWSQDTSSL